MSYTFPNPNNVLVNAIGTLLEMFYASPMGDQNIKEPLFEVNNAL